MPDVLQLFHNRPPRLLPINPDHRDKAERLLAHMAAEGDPRYDDYLERYNKLCDKYEVPRFPRVLVSRVVEPVEEKVETTTVVVEAEPQGMQTAEALSIEPVSVEVEKPKKGRKKKSSPPTDE